MSYTKSAMGTRLKRLRKDKQLTLRQLAERIDMDPSNLHKYELGEKVPLVTTLIRILGGMGMDLEEFGRKP